MDGALFILYCASCWIAAAHLARCKNAPAPWAVEEGLIGEHMEVPQPSSGLHGAHVTGTQSEVAHGHKGEGGVEDGE